MSVVVVSVVVVSVVVVSVVVVVIEPVVISPFLDFSGTIANPLVLTTHIHQRTKLVVMTLYS